MAITDPHLVDGDCRYTAVVKVFDQCYWLHLNCSTGAPYAAKHFLWESCWKPLRLSRSRKTRSFESPLRSRLRRLLSRS